MHRKEKQYSENALEEAVQMIKSQKISLSKASVQYNIPKGTLHNKVAGKTALQCRKGPGKILTDEEEEKINNWIINMAKVGYCVNTRDVIATVTKIFELKGLDKAPGKKWMQLFLQRHPNITKRHAEIISKARSLITEPLIRKWFAGLQEFLQQENVADILDDPDRIYNLDETGVQLCPKTGVILAPKNYPALYNIASGQEKQSITVLCNFSANGGIVTPFIVYPLQRISKEIVQSVPDDWGIGRSDSGWMTGQTFLSYVKDIYLPWLLTNKITLPVLLLVDGHKSHINLELHEFCVQNRIILYCLYPNTTHILQPCDVGIFGPLKAAWKTTARKHKNEENEQITRTKFGKLFAQAFKDSMKKSIIVNAFKACGIYPFNPNAVDYSKCISNRQEEIQNEISLKDFQTTVEVLEKHLAATCLAKYKELRRLNKTCKSSLFKFWNKCQNKMNNILISQSSNINDSATNNLTSSMTNMLHSTNQEHKNQELHSKSQEDTIGTNTFIEGILDIESLPIEIEGFNFLVDEVAGKSIINFLEPLPYTNNFEQYQTPSLDPELTILNPIITNVEKTPQNDFLQPGQYTTSTPVSSTSTNNLQEQNIGLYRQNMAAPSQMGEIGDNKIEAPILDPELTILNPITTNLEKTPRNHFLQPGQCTTSTPVTSTSTHNLQDQVGLCTQNMSTPSQMGEIGIYEIDSLLKLPEQKKGMTRKRKSPVPLAITSKKFKEYLELKENEKIKKTEAILNRKMAREMKKAEKEKETKARKEKKNESAVTKSKNTPKLDRTEKENVNFGSYAVVEFKTNKRNRYFVGEVIKLEKNTIKVKCLRKKSGYINTIDNLTYFVEPSTDDLTEVSRSAIKKVLKPPLIGRRGVMSFDSGQYDFELCE